MDWERVPDTDVVATETVMKPERVPEVAFANVASVLPEYNEIVNELTPAFGLT